MEVSRYLTDIDTRGEITQLLIDRGCELPKSGSATDKRVARELFVEAAARSSAVIRELEKTSPALKAIGRLLAKPRKRKAATG